MSMRGAVDLAALAAARDAQAKAEERRAANPPGTPGALSFDVTEESFQADVIDQSFVVPVVIDLWATWCGPCKTLSPVLEKLVVEYAGKFLLAKVDVDANPRISQAFQVQSIPSIVAVVKGQPVPLFQGALPEPAVRQYLDELLKVAESVGLGAAAAPDGEGAPETDAEEEPPGDPRYDAAYDAVQRGDWEAAEAAYREVLAQSPADSEAQAGLGQVALLRRTDGVDVAAALADADANPDSVPAQTLAADVELLTGRVEQAFARLVELVRRAGGDDRTAAREHLVGLFQLVGDADPQVAKARTALANALF
jgi:putative thioredoxin